MKKFIFFTSAFLVLVVLSNFMIKDFNAINNNVPKIPVVIDTLKCDKEFRNEDWMGFASYTPIYIGKMVDTLCISYKEVLSPVIPGFKISKYLYDERMKYYSTENKSKLLITVDTGRAISQYTWFIDSTEDAPAKRNIMKLKADLAYPVILENISQQTLKIGHAYTMLIIAEAKDKNGIWKPIERYNWYWGPEFEGMLLPPSQIAVTTREITVGDFHTKLRLKCGNCTSNEFDGSIYLTQFEEEYDQNGKRKTLPKR